MPKYSFVCNECGHYQEFNLTLQEYMDKEHFICSKCGNELRRSYEDMNFSLKGKDYYSKTKKDK
jgi:putative FmdB family regulatory protein